MKVPLFDLTRQYKALREEIMEGMEQVLASGRVILGPHGEALEQSIARSVGACYGIGVANGSDALLIAVAALGIVPGDYVITTPYTFFATASCITRNGGIPFFVDIDPVTFNLDLDQVEQALRDHPLRERIKGIIPVHLFGRVMDLDRLERLRKTHKIWIIEDCAQSIGAIYSGKEGSSLPAGSMGDLSTFSFFPTKNLGGYGDGGMIVSSNSELEQFCRSYRAHGSSIRYIHERIGINSRLDELQAVALKIKWNHLPDYTLRRRSIAQRYTRAFAKSGMPIHTPIVPQDMSHVFHQYVIRLVDADRKDRDSLRAFLSKNGVGTSVYYPMGLHQQRCFQHLPLPITDLPHTEQACDQTIALPIFPELTDEEVDYVVEQVRLGLKTSPSQR